MKQWLFIIHNCWKHENSLLWWRDAFEVYVWNCVDESGIQTQKVTASEEGLPVKTS